MVSTSYLEEHELLYLYKLTRCSKPHWRYLKSARKTLSRGFLSSKTINRLFFAEIHYIHTQTDVTKRIHAQGNKESWTFTKIHIKLLCNILSWICNAHVYWAIQYHYHNCLYCNLRIAGSHLHVHVRAHYALHNIVTLKAVHNMTLVPQASQVLSVSQEKIFFHLL